MKTELREIFGKRYVGALLKLYLANAKRCFMLLFALLSVSGLNASRTSKADSTGPDSEYIRTKAKEKLENLNLAFGFIAETRPSEGKEQLIQNLVREFHPEATIEVINSSGRVRSYNIEYYLRNVLNRKYRRMYKAVKIHFVSFSVENLRPHPTKEDTYLIDYWVDQIFCGSYSVNPARLNEEISRVLEKGYDYCDRTDKRGGMEITRIDDPLGRSKWLIQYQSIHVVSLKKVQKQ